MLTNTPNTDFSNTYRLPIIDKKGTYYFMTDEIIRLEANSAYTTLYFKSHPPFVVSKVLKIYEALLKPFGFVRTHRSHLVNRQFVRCITGDTVIMQDASVAELSRRQKRSVVQQLGGKSKNGYLVN